MPKADSAPVLTRRGFLVTAGLALCTPAILPGAAGGDAEPHPLARFDREIESFMDARKVPGGALAVLKDRRLVYVRGYGRADPDKPAPVHAETLFRIASLSKPITAVAVLKLVEEKKLSLEARALETAGLAPLAGPGGGHADERLVKITVRHLLQHTAGWDRSQSGDPMFRWKQFTQPTSSDCPVNPSGIIRHMLGQRLDFDPGTRYAYSNFGYCLLGRVIERVSGQPYEEFVQETILAPIGIKRMRVGASMTSGKGEATYSTADHVMVPSIFPQVSGRVPEPYGGFCLEAMDAHGGWVASVEDLARFAAALDDPQHSPLLKPETARLLYEPPPPPVWRRADGAVEEAYYAAGWMVRPVGSERRANYWHTGSLPGTSSLLVRRHDGLSWTVLFNRRSDDRKRPDDAIDSALHRAAASVKSWPQIDLFPPP
jgi:N-acyl-D-amino-acid deacylase